MVPAPAAEPVVSFSGKSILFPLVKYFACFKVPTWRFQIKALRALFAWGEQEGCPFPRRCCFLVAKMRCPPSAKHPSIFSLGQCQQGIQRGKKKDIFPNISPTAVKFFLMQDANKSQVTPKPLPEQCYWEVGFSLGCTKGKDSASNLLIT